MLKQLIMALLLLTFSLSGYAQSKEQMVGMLDMMKKNGLITEEQYKNSIQELNAMSEQQFAALKAQAEQVKNDPKIQKQINKLKKSGDTN